MNAPFANTNTPHLPRGSQEYQRIQAALFYPNGRHRTTGAIHSPAERDAAVQDEYRRCNGTSSPVAANPPPNRDAGSNLTVALSLAAVGLPVFPVRVSLNTAKSKWEKAPLIEGWQKNASTNPNQIRAWWREWPNAITGIELGRADLVLIDADRHGGPDGVAAFTELVGKRKDLKPHPVCETAGNGEHHYFKQMPGIKLGNSPGDLPPGIDVRGVGGFAVAPGSVRPDGKRWSPAGLAEAYKSGNIPIIPDWLALIIKPPGLAQNQGQAQREERVKQNGKESGGAAPHNGEGIKAPPDELAKVKSALPCIPSDDRNKNWFVVGAALHSTGWNCARELWDDWARTSAKFNDKDQNKTWKSFARGYKGKPVTIASLLKLAQEHGWQHPGLGGAKPAKLPAPEEPPSPDEVKWPDLGKGGKPLATCANARKAIETLGIKCRYDTFHDRKLVGGHAIEQWAGEFSDHACQMLRVLIKERFGFDPGKENTNDAAVQLCLQHQFDPVRDYLDGLKWDGIKRLDRWMPTYLGAEDTELTRAIGRLALVAAVRRVRQPGCKFDEITVLEGPEGTGKSTAIESLAGKENFSDQTILGLDDRQQQENVRGVWLYEIADLAGMSKADVDKVKAFASRVSDRARPAYGRQRVDLPRRCIFFATTNNETYLKSQTGNRRFWPVKTGEIDLAGLRRDRDQLWAEAAKIDVTGVPLKLPETLWSAAAIEQDKRRDPDPWDEMLANVKGTVCDAPNGGREERISTTELLRVHLTLPADKCNDAAAKRLSYSMKRLGWEKPSDPIRIPGVIGKVRGFRRQIAPE
jgi:Virulence-associated protein E/Bifunctional DNA primase/polymerase, N-terminal/Primase C terminal 2 (PriCT-2)